MLGRPGPANGPAGNQEEESDDEELYKKVFVGTDGYTFGELALISNKPRAATIQCSENCHLASLDRASF